MKKILIAILVVAIFAAMLAGCTNRNNNTTVSPTVTVKPTAAATLQPTTTMMPTDNTALPTVIPGATESPTAWPEVTQSPAVTVTP